MPVNRTTRNQATEVAAQSGARTIEAETARRIF